MSTITRMPLFLRFNLGADVKELFMGTARTPRGCDANLSLALFAKNQVLDLSNVASLKLEIADGNAPTSARLVSKTIVAASITPFVSKDQFAAGTAAHAVVNLTGDELNPDIGGASAKQYTIILSGVTSAGTKLFYGSGDFVIYEDGNSDNANPPPAITQPTYLTTAQVQALVASLGGGGSGASVDFTIRSLTGGGAAALDGVTTAGRSLPYVKLIIIGDALQGWLLYADAVTAADGAVIVQPLDYNAISNV